MIDMLTAFALSQGTKQLSIQRLPSNNLRKDGAERYKWLLERKEREIDEGLFHRRERVDYKSVSMSVRMGWWRKGKAEWNERIMKRANRRATGLKKIPDCTDPRCNACQLNPGEGVI